MKTYATGSITVALVDQAIDTCRNAVRPGSLIMAQPTTVGVITGEGEYVLDRRVPVTDAFPNAARRDFAAWCARHEPNGREMYYAALPNGEIAAAKP
jgi:hypothetical protein